jgi:hypothetical protein
MPDIELVKVFSETMARERQSLGEKVTKYLQDNQDLVVMDKVITQSSDSAFHCLSIVLFMSKR